MSSSPRLAPLDPLGLGITIDERSNLVAGDNTSSPTLFAVGPPCRAQGWEITAVPDIRVQVAQVVHGILDAGP